MCAPIVKYMSTWSEDKIFAYCKRKGWKAEHVNNYTAIVNLTHDVEDLKLGERDVKKLRVADNTFGKNSETRFFDVIVSSGPDMETAGRLAKGDQIVVTGTLVK